ncbi:MAG: hypothetical protein KDC26_11555 [Armatimonadetes bacterium]|nr:hypothetical protein [Armatimonadota bacterium]
MSVSKYPCEQCGAQLDFEPGTTDLKCQYCGFQQQINPTTEIIQELDFHAFISENPPQTDIETAKALHCNSCGAEYSMGPYQVAGACPFCGSNAVVSTEAEARISPKSLLPFRIKANQAKDLFGKWVGGRFWAPNNLKKLALLEHGLHGIYIPYWTYDSNTVTQYSGMRGIWHYRTETYRDSNGNTQTRQVRYTEWYPAAGTVFVPFDDVLVLGSTHLPPKYAQALSSWQLGELTPYQSEFLSGFQAMRYDVDLEDGFETAQKIMDPTIRQAIHRDIGGNEQRITSMSVQYNDLTFKHILLPIWSGAYRYKGKSWSYLVNGQTGEIRGEAPVSAWKVAIAVILGLLVIGTIIYFTSQSK